METNTVLHTAQHAIPRQSMLSAYADEGFTVPQIAKTKSGLVVVDWCATVGSHSDLLRAHSISSLHTETRGEETQLVVSTEVFIELRQVGILLDGEPILHGGKFSNDTNFILAVRSSFHAMEPTPASTDPVFLMSPDTEHRLFGVEEARDSWEVSIHNHRHSQDTVAAFTHSNMELRLRRSSTVATDIVGWDITCPSTPVRIAPTHVLPRQDGKEGS